MSVIPSPPLLDVIAVEPLKGFNLRLTFENAEIRRFSMANFLARASGVFVPVRRMELFRQAYVENGTVCWPGGADLDPEFLYERSVPEYMDDPAVTAADAEEDLSLENEVPVEMLEGVSTMPRISGFTTIADESSPTKIEVDGDGECSQHLVDEFLRKNREYTVEAIESLVYSGQLPEPFPATLDAVKPRRWPADRPWALISDEAVDGAQSDASSQ